ncbi:MAG: hypothetical protein N3F09_10560 [Bacteroidia bacterium]|nr:hypothetical protein [Bacteroidia bacterium]
MNDKYIIRFEAGPMEQVYKIPAEEFCGIEKIKKLIQKDNMETILDVFLKMKKNTMLFYLK